MEVRELSKDEKLMVIDEIFSEWNEEDKEMYICVDIKYLARQLGFISSVVYENGVSTDAVVLIPELLEFKPENLCEGESWFGKPGVYGDKRTQVLRKLREIISKK